MNNTTTTTLTLKEADLLILLWAMEGVWTDHMAEDELTQHDKMHARLVKALERI